MTKHIWHYTIGRHLPAIRESKVIKLSTKNVPANERATVWFSSNSIWENTCNKVWESRNGRITWLTKEETHKLGGGLFRIEVSPDAAPYNWEDFKRLSGISRGSISHMEMFQRKVGARNNQWYCSFDEVPSDYWLDIQIWNAVGKTWETFRQAE